MRVVFALLLALCAFIMGNFESTVNTVLTFLALIVVVLFSFFIDFRLQMKKLRGTLVGALGLVLGLLIARLFASQVVTPILSEIFASPAELGTFASYALLVFSIVFGYFGYLIGRNTADDIRLFSEDGPKSEKRTLYIMDMDALIDGRLVRIATSPLLRGEMVIPRYVVEELESQNSSKDPIQKSRGQRGLDNLKTLESQRDIRLYIRDIDIRPGTEDRALLKYAQEHGAVLISKRDEFKKTAQRANVPLIDFNEISSLLSPDVATGDEFVIKLIKPGKEMDQAVGYLNDGNMVVVENARSEIGKTVRVAVTGIHQTKAGTLIFAQLKR